MYSEIFQKNSSPAGQGYSFNRTSATSFEVYDSESDIEMGGLFGSDSDSSGGVALSEDDAAAGTPTGFNKLPKKLRLRIWNEILHSEELLVVQKPVDTHGTWSWGPYGKFFLTKGALMSINKESRSCAKKVLRQFQGQDFFNPYTDIVHVGAFCHNTNEDDPIMAIIDAEGVKRVSFWESGMAQTISAWVAKCKTLTNDLYPQIMNDCSGGGPEIVLLLGVKRESHRLAASIVLPIDHEEYDGGWKALGAAMVKDMKAWMKDQEIEWERLTERGLTKKEINTWEEKVQDLNEWLIPGRGLNRRQLDKWNIHKGEICVDVGDMQVPAKISFRQVVYEKTG